MNIFKKIAGVDTPPAPKFKPLALPTLGEGEIPFPMSPYLAPGSSWSSSDSGSSVSSVPSTPSTSPAPWRRPPMTPFHRAPSVRSPTPQIEMRSPAWHVMTSDVEKHLSRHTLTPSPELVRQPRARRAPSAHNPSPVQVMQGLVSPGPLPEKPVKPILKRTMPPRSTASTPAPAPPLRTSEVSLHWQLCPPYAGGRRCRLEYDITQPVEMMVIRDYTRPYPYKKTPAETREYLMRKVSETQQLRKMEIRYAAFPQWVVTVNRSDGGELLVEDVLHSLFEDLHTVLTRMDRQRYIDKKDIDAYVNTFQERCKKSVRGVAEQTAGIRRVDMLLGKTLFGGLTRAPKDDQNFWIAHFGPLPSSSPS